MSIQDLIPLSDALKLGKPDLYKIIRDFLPYSDYCANTIMIPDKMAEWCTYLQCDGTKCHSDIVSQVMNKPTLPQHKNSNCKLNISVDPILKYNTSCFDSFFCVPIWASKDYHYVLGILGFVLAMISLLVSIFYAAAFRREFGKRHTPALLLLSQAICDILFISITVLGFITIFTSSVDLADQVKLYSSVHIYIVAYILPFACCFESLSFWIIILLIFDRYNYLSHGSHSKNLLTTKLCFTLLGGIALTLIAMAILRIFRFKIIPLDNNLKYLRLVDSELGKDVTFDNLIQFWLKMPFESLLPLSVVFIIIIMVLHKLIYAGLGNSSKSSFVYIQEHLLTKSILFICFLLLAVKVPKLVLHIMKYEIGIDSTQAIIFELVCHLLDQMYLFVKSCIVYRYACPIFTNWLQNKLCIDSGYMLSEYVDNAPSSLDEYKNLEYGFEKKCKKSMFIDPNLEKETDV